jgi:hypothetical protein
VSAARQANIARPIEYLNGTGRHVSAALAATETFVRESAGWVLTVGPTISLVEVHTMRSAHNDTTTPMKLWTSPAWRGVTEPSGDGGHDEPKQKRVIKVGEKSTLPQRHRVASA